MVRTYDIPPTTIGTTNTIIINPNPNSKVQALYVQNRSTVTTSTLTVKLNGTDAASGTGIVLAAASDASGEGEKLVLSTNEGYVIPSENGVAVIGNAATSIMSAHIEVV